MVEGVAYVVTFVCQIDIRSPNDGGHHEEGEDDGLETFPDRFNQTTVAK